MGDDRSPAPADPVGASRPPAPPPVAPPSGDTVALPPSPPGGATFPLPSVAARCTADPLGWPVTAAAGGPAADADATPPGRAAVDGADVDGVAGALVADGDGAAVVRTDADTGSGTLAVVGWAKGATPGG